jgi:hypothetical protein
MATRTASQQTRPAPSPATGHGCDRQPADVFVAFGITGDLAKVNTFSSLYRLEQRGLLDGPIVGVAVDDWTVDRLREHARASIQVAGQQIDNDMFDRFAARLSYVSGDFGDGATYQRLAKAIGEARLPVFYLEIPPVLFATVVRGLSQAGLTKTARVVVEKPFGHDLASALRDPAARSDRRRQRTLHAPRRRRGDMADHATPTRRPTASSQLRTGNMGAARRRRPRRRTWPLARAVDDMSSLCSHQDKD